MKAVIFDLDGVIVSTDEYHYEAWLRLANEEGIPFDRAANEALRGVSRMECLEIILRRSPRTYTDQEKQALAERKNVYYRELLQGLSPARILPGVLPFLEALNGCGIAKAIGSSSKNARPILTRIGLAASFDTIVDGNDIANSKPDPEVFLLAARRLGVSPADCIVIEDADAGIEAAVAAQMKVLGVGPASRHPKADYTAPDMAAIQAQSFLKQALSL